MKWTADQQAAIEAPKDSVLDAQTLLVAAAAGSGKTAVLVERIISRLKDTTNPLSIQELLVVTFTKAAAAEMSARIGVALAKELEATGDEELEKQLNLLPSAHISTLHSFCQWVIKSYFYHLDMNPLFRIGNEGEMQLMKQEVLSEIVTKAYEEDTYHIFELADMFSNDKSDEQLYERILRLYHYAMAQSNPNLWLQQIVERYREIQTLPLVETMWGKHFWAEQAETIENLVTNCNTMQELLEIPGAPEPWQKLLDAILPSVKSLVEATDWQSMHEAVQQVQTIKYGTASKTKAFKDGTIDEAIAARFQALRNQAKDTLTAMSSGVFTLTEDDWKSQIESQIPIIEGLVNITIHFRKAFEAAKQAEGLLDFSDLEHLCLKLLIEPGTEGNPQPSSVALELQQAFKEVMVDEYQDTNGVQEAIVNLVSHKDNRFYVGDVKQSIYGFRMADSTLFMNKYKTYGGVDDVERRIDLAQNFRSDENVLRVTNFIFYQIMTESAAELTYGERESLVPGRIVDDAPAEWIGGDVELHLIDVSKEAMESSSNAIGASEDEGDEPENEERELGFIIEKILELKHNGSLVQEKDGSFRPLEWRDIVILRRSLAGKGNRMVEAMRNAGIPAYVNEASGYFDALEIQMMLSLLSIIDNPEQDLPMAAILHSGLVGLDANELGHIRLLGKQLPPNSAPNRTSLWSLLPIYAEQTGDTRITQFVADIERWRTLSRRQGVAELLWDIYESKDYVNYVGAMPNGLVRRANVMALYERAKDYENGGFRGLFRFLRFIESLRDAGQDLSVANVVSEADNVVRIMTIHKSKGLEFPVVFLSGIQKQFNMLDLRSNMLLHKTAGMGLQGYYPEYRVVYPSMPWLYSKRVLELALKAEEQRILYVALTRARDKLFLTGFVKGLDGRAESLGAPAIACEEQSLPKDLITKANSYLDWIIMAFARHLDGGNLIRSIVEAETVGNLDLLDKRCKIKVELHNGADYGQLDRKVDVDDDVVTRVGALEPVNAVTLDETIAKRFDFHYEYQEATQRVAKISVSELKRRFAERDLEAVEATEVVSTEVAVNKTIPTNIEANQTISSNAEKTDLPNLHQAVQDSIFGRKPVILEHDAEQVTGAQWGTLMHEAMQWLPVQTYTLDSMTTMLDKLTRNGRFTKEERALLNDKALYEFFHSDLGQRLVSSNRVERELPFSMLFDGQRVYKTLEFGEQLFLQGIVDTVFQEGDAWVLVDYKTDRVKSPDELVSRYKIQMELYKEALERLTGMKVKESYIYSFRLRESVKI